MAHLQLAIEIDSDPISGSVSNGRAGTQSFTGWIDLVAAIEAARTASHAWEDSGGPDGEPTMKTLGLVPGAKAGEE